jgi:hypothetical protein
MMRLAELGESKLLPERMSALIRLSGQIRRYLDEFNNTPLALIICKKKIDFILQAKSNAELNEILAAPKVRYNFEEVVPIGKFHIEEEELLIWSLTSLWSGGPLNEAGFKRYTKLFAQIFPDVAKEIGIT